jgi:hypothetical protein
MGGSDEYPQGHVANLSAHAASLEAMMPCLADLGAQVPALLTQGASLISSAPHDFTGLREVLKLPAVLSGLHTATTELQHALRISASTLSNVKSLTSAAKAFKGQGHPPQPTASHTVPVPRVAVEATASESDVPWYWRVTNVSAAGIRLEGPGTAHLVMGRQLIVIAMGDTLRDPATNRPLYIETRDVGRVEITYTDHSFTVAKAVGRCDEMRAGDIAVLPPLPPRAQR